MLYLYSTVHNYFTIKLTPNRPQRPPEGKKLRLGAQSVTLLSTLRDPTQLRRHQCATKQQHPFLLHIVVLFRVFNFSAPNHE